MPEDVVAILGTYAEFDAVEADLGSGFEGVFEVDFSMVSRIPYFIVSPFDALRTPSEGEKLGNHR